MFILSFFLFVNSLYFLNLFPVWNFTLLLPLALFRNLLTIRKEHKKMKDTRSRKKEVYQAPDAEVVEVNVERGFAVTNNPFQPGGPW